MTGAPPFKILLSYHYVRQIQRPLPDEVARWFVDLPDPVLFLDSGAFSAMTQGAPIDVHDYGRWLQKYAWRCHVYSNLDVIGDGDRSAEGTWTNQRVLEDEYGLSPLPVFHVGEPWSALDRLLEAGYTYIALGGLVGRPTTSVMPWLVRCFRVVDGAAVFHGFGLTSWTELLSLPWYSVDSSSWSAGSRYGSLVLFDDRTGQRRRCRMGDHASVYAMADLIRHYGLDPALFAATNKPGRHLINATSAISWWRVEQWLRRRHGLIAIPGQPEQPTGFAAYYADTNINDLSDGGRGLHLYFANTDMEALAVGGRAISRPQEVTA